MNFFDENGKIYGTEKAKAIERAERNMRLSIGGHYGNLQEIISQMVKDGYHPVVAEVYACSGGNKTIKTAMAEAKRALSFVDATKNLK